MKLLLSVGIVAMAIAAAPLEAADLSPQRWPAEERASLERDQSQLWPALAGDVMGHSFLVTGTTSPEAVHAGAEALRQGGTAADAAATVALTQIATNFGQAVTYAGKMELLYFDARNLRLSVLDGGWATYVAETSPQTIPDPNSGDIGGPTRMVDVSETGRQTLVPGFMAGIAAMHARFGRLPWADLFQPAIWYAENGVTVTPARAGGFQEFQTRFWRTPEGKRFASMPDGSLPKSGDVLRQSDLAQTLREVAAHGAAYMYRGPWARAFVDAVRARGGKGSLEDLARYRPIWRDPISVRFAGADVYGMGESDLACSSLVALNVLSAMGVERMGPYWRDPTAFKAYTRAIRFATTRQYLPAKFPPEEEKGIDGSSCQARVEPAYGAALAPDLMVATPTWLPASLAAPEAGHHTQAVIAIDRWGDVAALVHTSNGSPTGIVVGGVTISEGGAVSKSQMRDIKPGDRVRQDLAPLIALRNGKPVLAIGAIGTSLGPETVRLVGEVLSGHADLRTVQGAPPLLYMFTPPAPGQTIWTWPQAIPEHAYDAAFLTSVASAGIPTEEEPLNRVIASLRGEAAVATIDPQSGTLTSAEVPLVDGYAESDVQQGVHSLQRTSLPESLLNTYAGDYGANDGHKIHLERFGDHLLVTVDGAAQRTEVFAASDQQLTDASGGNRLSMVLDPSGRATALVMFRGFHVMFARKEPPP